MRIQRFGPAKILRWSWDTERLMRAEARVHLLQKFRVGTFKDGEIANSVIQHQFVYFSAKLNAAIPLLAGRDSLEFILNQYEEATKILHGLQITDARERQEWLRMEGNFRRAMKYIAELIALQEPTSALNTTREESMRAMDQALLAAEMVTDLAEQSNRVYGILPNDAEVTIHGPGGPIDWDVRITGPHANFDAVLLARVAVDRDHRSEFISGAQFDLHTVNHQKELDPAFTGAFGWDYGHFLSALRNIIDGCRPVPNGFPTLFVRRQGIVDQLVAQGAPPAAVELMLTGFTISPARMREEGRVIWNPKQEHRAYRRGFLAFPHGSGPHIAFSRQMAMEGMIHLVHGVCYKRLPQDWLNPQVQSALERLSRQSGLWFEDVVAQNAAKLGVVGARAKDRVGSGPLAVQIPPDIGEIDFLGVEPRERLLVLIEAKMVNSGLEGKYWRDDIDTFVTRRDAYAVKFRKKIAWVQSQRVQICTALGVSGEHRVAPVMVTLYPCVAATFIPDFACVSLAELMLDYRVKKGWPYQLP